MRHCRRHLVLGNQVRRVLDRFAVVTCLHSAYLPCIPVSLHFPPRRKAPTPPLFSLPPDGVLTHSEIDAVVTNFIEKNARNTLISGPPRNGQLFPSSGKCSDVLPDPSESASLRAHFFSLSPVLGLSFPFVCVLLACRSGDGRRRVRAHAPHDGRPLRRALRGGAPPRGLAQKRNQADPTPARGCVSRLASRRRVRALDFSVRSCLLAALFILFLASFHPLACMRCIPSAA